MLVTRRCLGISMGGTKAEAMVINIKVKYEDEMRRLVVKPGLSLSDLRTKIFKLFKLNGDSQQLEIRFTDEDGDVLKMSNDDDVDYSFNQGVYPLRLEVSWSRKLATCLKKCRGPCGGGGGTYWKDGIFKGITAITVTTDSTTLRSIQITYATGKGKTYIAPRHGGGSGKKICTIFKYPSEKLQKISGYCGTVCGCWTVIKGLKFETNRAKYGPFGVVARISF
ncbi:hypothetical protein SUGI_1086010 [Cryptomeria japonica]|nr:hypothetical protein SUGI_1086010 [Cryptomeria japonica]